MSRYLYYLAKGIGYRINPPLHGWQGGICKAWANLKRLFKWDATHWLLYLNMRAACGLFKGKSNRWIRFLIRQFYYQEVRRVRREQRAFRSARTKASKDIEGRDQVSYSRSVRKHTRQVSTCFFSQVSGFSTRVVDNRGVTSSYASYNETFRG